MPMRANIVRPPSVATRITHEVEGIALEYHYSVRIHQGFLRAHLIGDRCVMQLLVRVHRRTSPLRNRQRSADQCQQSYRRGHLSHDGSPSCGRPPSRFMVTGISITKVRRPHVSFRCSSTSLTLAQYRTAFPHRQSDGTRGNRSTAGGSAYRAEPDTTALLMAHVHDAEIER